MRRSVALMAISSLFAVLLAAEVTAAGPPTATTGPALSLTSSSANLTGSVNPNGLSTMYSFQFGTTTAYGFQTNPQSAGSGTENQVVSSTLTGLDSGTTYHYRLMATNTSGTTFGMDLTFTTLGTSPPPPTSPPPTARTGNASGIGQHRARIRGVVNPKGARTTYYFEVGLTAAYGMQTTARSLSAGTRSRSVSATLTGLLSGQTYHYRIVARNVNGVALGADRTFSTSPEPAARALPAVTARVRPRRDRTRPYRFRVRGSVIPPAAVDSSLACRGRVSIRFKVRKKTVRVRRVRLRRDCRYRGRATVRLRPRRHSVRLRIKVRFRGNSVLRPRSAPTQTARAG